MALMQIALQSPIAEAFYRCDANSGQRPLFWKDIHPFGGHGRTNTEHVFGEVGLFEVPLRRITINRSVLLQKILQYLSS